MRHRATRREVAGSIPSGAIGIFHSGRTVAMYSASNRNEYQEYPLEGKGGRCVELTLHVLSLEILGASNLVEP